MANKRATLADVARLAEVSKATASVVINHRVGRNIRVNAATEARVLEAARELGYVANSAARVLAGQHNRIIAIFTYEPIFPVEHRDYFYPFLLGIEAEAERRGYDLLLMTSTGGADGRTIYQRGENRLKIADGVVILGLRRNNDEIRRLLGEDFPIVFIGRREFDGYTTSYVASDYVRAAGAIAKLVLDRGHRSIAYLRSTEESESAEDREAGFRAAIVGESLGGDACPVIRTGPEEVNATLLDRLRSRGVTAFLAESYYYAAAIVAAARLGGREVPRDFSVAILDGPGADLASQRDWTRFVQRRHELGALALATLVDLLEERATAPIRRIIDCDIVAGETVGAPPPAR